MKFKVVVFPKLIFQPPTTEEDVITRCRSAIAEGLDLVKRCYERHEIQDSDSDDEDSPSRFVALLNNHLHSYKFWILSSVLSLYFYLLDFVLYCFDFVLQ